ncbi:MAG TPA: hypothetical protein VGM93_02195, partial [Acidimicrobiales bacterium]
LLASAKVSFLKLSGFQTVPFFFPLLLAPLAALAYALRASRRRAWFFAVVVYGSWTILLVNITNYFFFPGLFAFGYGVWTAAKADGPRPRPGNRPPRPPRGTRGRPATGAAEVVDADVVDASGREAGSVDGDVS